MNEAEDYFEWVKKNFSGVLESLIAYSLADELGNKNVEIDLIYIAAVFTELVNREIYKKGDIGIVPNIFASDSEVRKANYLSLKESNFPKKAKKPLVRIFKKLQRKKLIEVVSSKKLA